LKLFPKRDGGGAALRRLLAESELLEVPGCFDALSARILEASGFRAAFLGGFSLSAARLGLPDTGLLSYGEMIDAARDVCAAVSIPVFGDADTGYGNPVNAERTALGCAQAGLASILIEDQTWPKRCGHTAGKETVDRTEALARVKACVRAREEHELDILVMARTDAAATDGFDEALWRVEAFADAGADITFLEAPTSAEQMRRYGASASGWKTANLVEDGKTPWLRPDQLAELGFKIAIYPVSLLLHSISALQRAAREIGSPGTDRASFEEAQRILGRPDYDARLSGKGRVPGT